MLVKLFGFLQFGQNIKPCETIDICMNWRCWGWYWLSESAERSVFVADWHHSHKAYPTNTSLVNSARFERKCHLMKKIEDNSHIRCVRLFTNYSSVSNSASKEQFYNLKVVKMLFPYSRVVFLYKCGFAASPLGFVVTYVQKCDPDQNVLHKNRVAYSPSSAATLPR